MAGDGQAHWNEGRLCGECDVNFGSKKIALLSCGHVFVPHFPFHFVNCVFLISCRPAGSSNRFKHASWVMEHCGGIHVFTCHCSWISFYSELIVVSVITTIESIAAGPRSL